LAKISEILATNIAFLVPYNQGVVYCVHPNVVLPVLPWRDS